MWINELCQKKTLYLKYALWYLYSPICCIQKNQQQIQKISLILYLSLPLFLPEKKDGIASLNSIWVYTDKGPVNKWIQKLFS